MNNKDIVVTFEDENEIVIKLESKTFLNLQKKTVAPSTEEQVVRSDSGYEGLKEVTIEAVTNTIDNNIVSSNIKKNVTILGVEGTLEPILQSKSASPSSNDQIITPDENYDGLSSVSIRAMHLEIFSITPRTYNQTLTPSPGYDALGKVTINKVTSAIDSNITPENIKNGVTILGVEGTFDTPEYEGSYEITSNGTYATSGKKMTQDLVVNISGATNFEKLIDGSIVNVTSDVTTIKKYAFRDCLLLKTCVFNNVTTISTFSFYDCSSLESITIKTNSVASLDINVFGNQAGSLNDNYNHKIYIYVPSDLVDSYKTATNWGNYYNNGKIDIFAITE